MLKSERPFVIPVFLPHSGCPHQCAFCNQKAITGAEQNFPSLEKLHQLITAFLGYNRHQRNRVQIAFYGGNFLGLKQNQIISLLHFATKFVKKGYVDSLRFSTRPDTISREALCMIRNFPVSTVEIGAQSMDDKILAMAKRGHTSLDTVKAVELLKEFKYEIGIQMMVGLPADSKKTSLSTGWRIAKLLPDFVRIYPTVVLENSPLAAWYKNGNYKPLPLDQCVTIVKRLYLLFSRKNIRVIRMGLQASSDLGKKTTVLAGPYHPSFGHLVFSEIFLDRATALLKVQKTPHDKVTIKVHPRCISEMKGIRNINVEALKKKFQINCLKIIPDSSIKKGEVIISECSSPF
ncbi:MAG: radical SAM protein [Desulfobacterales bacterium]|nr:radical SAM protein [Desulfobacterales bacterium]